jgi:hypothetical protein
MSTLPREKAAGVALADRRVLWLTRLSAPRGRSAKSMSAAQWEPGEGLARVLRHKGIDLQSLGHFRGGQQWLRPEEALCMVDDGTLLLLHDGAPLSVQAARALLVGPCDSTGRAATLQLRLTIFICLHRNGYVGRIRDPPGLGAPPPAGEPDLIAAYERRGFTRRAVDKEDLPPAFIVACHRADEPLPGADVLSALADRCAPVPLRCACVQHDVVVFFNIATDIQRPSMAGENAACASNGADAGTTGPNEPNSSADSEAGGPLPPADRETGAPSPPTSPPPSMCHST